MSEPMTAEELAPILEKHWLWNNHKAGGVKANLTGVNLTGANLAHVYLNGANLTGANLTGANLTRANMAGAILAMADLAEANLTSANLRWTDLTMADLSGADLTDADLTGTYLTWAYLSGAKLPCLIIQIGPLGSRNDYLLYRDDAKLVQTGCFEGTLEEFEAEVTKTHGDNKHGKAYRAAIALIRTMIADKEEVLHEVEHSHIKE